MKTQSMPITVRFFKYMLEEKSCDKYFHKPISIKDLFSCYCDFITNTKEKHETSQHKFYIQLTNYKNLCKVKLSGNKNGVEINKELTQELVEPFDLI